MQCQLIQVAQGMLVGMAKNGKTEALFVIQFFQDLHDGFILVFEMH
jgi:hypothetical protein